jgi:hypothetical protein
MLYPRGIATESFVLSQNGTIGVTLTNAGSVSALGIGLGIPNPNAPGCVLTTTVTAGASSTAQITTGADAGTYCVSIYDVGFVPPTGVTFTISVSHP